MGVGRKGCVKFGNKVTFQDGSPEAHNKYGCKQAQVLRLVGKQELLLECNSLMSGSAYM